MIRVAIVDDQELLRAGLRSIIQSQDDLDVVADYPDGFAALAGLQHSTPDLILLDLQMPGINGVEVTRRIRALPMDRAPRILVLTTFELDDNVVNALQAGADGFLGKGASPREIIESIRSVAEGVSVLSPIALNLVIGHVANQRSAPSDPEMIARFSSLTVREREIVEHLVRGRDGDSIARDHHLSPLTVKTHITRAMNKVGARDRAQLVTYAVRAGILP
ncbi:response regulator transcription factor [Herbiconiux sp. 11R-BC]|uniref:response regulator n=1 Tax=Herbiconiux sp. 11R-BC TaxID=3111637 RepID=UPI003BFBC544